MKWGFAIPNFLESGWSMHLGRDRISRDWGLRFEEAEVGGDGDIVLDKPVLEEEV